MPENNHVCGVCGVGYYCCNASEAYNSPKRIACSDECFRVWVAWINYRDGLIDRDEYVRQVDASGMDLAKLHGVMAESYHAGEMADEPKTAPRAFTRRKRVK